MENKQEGQSILALAELTEGEGPGPRMGLGGWGLPGMSSGRPKLNASKILGYGMEKIATQFRTLRNLTLEGQDLMQSVRLTQTRFAKSKSSGSGSRRQKEAKEAQQRLLNAVKQTDTNLNTVLPDLEYVHDMEADDKKDLLKTLGLTNVKHSVVENIVLSTLHSAKDREEFDALLEAMGGEKAVGELIHDLNYGTYQCLLENYGIADWKPPFTHELFEDSPEDEVSPDDKATFENLISHLDEDFEPVFTREFLERFMFGDITASDLMGLSREELYMIAQRGYDLIQQGKLDLAQHVFDGLVYLDPYDPYFHTVLGSVRQRQEDSDGAVACYDQAITLQPWNISALANRGEIYFNQGKFPEAMQDFQRVIYFDQEDKNPSTLRVKTLVLALGEALQKESDKAQPDAE